MYNCCIWNGFFLTGFWHCYSIKFPVQNLQGLNALFSSCSDACTLWTSSLKSSGNYTGRDWNLFRLFQCIFELSIGKTFCSSNVFKNPRDDKDLHPYWSNLYKSMGNSISPKTFICNFIPPFLTQKCCEICRSTSSISQTGVSIKFNHLWLKEPSLKFYVPYCSELNAYWGSQISRSSLAAAHGFQCFHYQSNFHWM